MLALANELQFLLILLQHRLGGTFPPEADLLRLLPLDWEKFLNLAESERVAPLVYHIFQEELGDLPEAALPSWRWHQLDLPIWLLHRLRTWYHGCALSNRTLLREFFRLWPYLQAQGLEVIPLKGLHLIPTLYQNWGLRPMSDLDLLVKPHEVSAVAAILQAQGYSPDPTMLPLKYHLMISFHLPDFRKGAHLRLEIHTDFKSRPQLDLNIEEVWQSARHAELFPGHSLPLLTPEHHLTFLLIHLDKHLFLSRASLIWLHDIAEFMGFHLQNLDYQELRRIWGKNELLLWRYLRLVARIFQLQEVSALLSRETGHGMEHPDNAFLAWEELVLRKLFFKEYTPIQFVGNILGLIDGWGNRAMFLWHHIFVSPTRIRLMYPGKPGYYPYFVAIERPVLLLFRLIRGLLLKIYR